MYNIEELNLKLLSELKEIAEKLGVSQYKKLPKKELIYKILDQQALLPESDLPKRKKTNLLLNQHRHLRKNQLLELKLLKKRRKRLKLLKRKKKLKLNLRKKGSNLPLKTLNHLLLNRKLPIQMTNKIANLAPLQKIKDQDRKELIVQTIKERELQDRKELIKMIIALKKQILKILTGSLKMKGY
jgi:hypothetical protein